MIKIVTDSSVDMPQNWARDYDIHILPIMIRFGDKTYLHGVDIDNEGFYRLVNETHTIPKTSLPSPQQIAEFYQKIASPEDEVLSIHVSSRMSGTFNAVELAARELSGSLHVTPFDSLAGSAFIGFLCREARKLAVAGSSIQSIVDRLDEMREKLSIIFTLDTLEFAYLNGRISYLQNALSSLLKIKPIIILKDGTLSMTERVRSRRKALDRVLELIRDRVGGRPVTMAVVHAADPLAAESIVEKIHQMFNIKELLITDLSISVAANLGPGAIGIVAIPE